MNPCSSRNVEGWSPNVSTSSARRYTKGGGADRVDTPEEAPHPRQCLLSFKVRGAPALPGVDGEAEAGMLAQGGAREHRGRNHRDLGASASSCAKACSSRICSVLQRPGR